MALKHKVLHLAAGDMIRELEALNGVKFGAESIRIVNEHMKRREDMWIAEIEQLERELAQSQSPAPSAAGAAEPGNAAAWRELHREPFYLWETDQFIARVEAEPESIAWNWHVEIDGQEYQAVCWSADEAKRAAEQWIATHEPLPGESEAKP